MMNHGKIRQSLYDFVRNDLPAEKRSAVEEHLRRCAGCRNLLADISAVAEVLHPEPVRPSEHLPDSYWQRFPAEVARRLAGEAGDARRRSSPSGDLWAILWGNRRWAFAAGGTAVAVGLMMFLLRPGEVRQTASPATTPTIPVAHTDDPVGQLFRRSRVLLVGIDNMETPAGHTLDLSVEHETSRDLVRETRTLKPETLDPHSAIVVRDLERILIELANAGERPGSPNVELIRSGMRQENILFRLRMAEAVRDSVRMMQVK